jgi:DNA-binding transcriptional ArsR family regulator
MFSLHVEVKTKLSILKVLKEYDYLPGLTPQQVSKAIGGHPVTVRYYLRKHLRDKKLVKRVKRVGRGRYRYKITDKGRKDFIKNRDEFNDPKTSHKVIGRGLVKVTVDKIFDSIDAQT